MLFLQARPTAHLLLPTTELCNWPESLVLHYVAYLKYSGPKSANAWRVLLG